MKVADTELIILKILWNEAPLTIGQIISRAQQTTDWHDNTIKTIVTRLFKKELVDRKKDGKQFFYSPVIEKSQVINQASDNLLGRFFEGKLSPLIAHFAQNQKINDTDIKEIEAILEQMKLKDDRHD
jgi:predicted transcriptional regulator